MRRFFSAFCSAMAIASTLLSVLPSTARSVPTVQAGIFHTSWSPITLTTRFKVSGGDLTTSVSIPFAFTVTMRYLTSYGISVTPPSSTYGVTLDRTITSGSYTYKVYSVVTTTSSSFTSGVQYDLYSINISGGTGYGTFQLVNDAVTSANNGDWYFEYNAIDYTNYSIPFYAEYATPVPLPVQLVSFQGSRLQDRVMLDWKTASELNNSGFDVERSVDNTAWRKLDFVQGHGTTDQPHAYSYVDDLKADVASFPSLYYRLRQLDRDGRHTYSDVVTVANMKRLQTVSPASAQLLPAYPNPFNRGSGGNGSTTIPLRIDQEQPVTLYITNPTGGVVQWMYMNEHLRPGLYAREFSAAGLPSGTYFVVLQTINGTVRERLVLTK